MAEIDLQCSLITPEGKIFEGPADYVLIPAYDGQLGILPAHAPLMCKLGSGRLRIRSVEGEQSWFVSGGFCQVVKDQVAILTQVALRPDQINREHALQMLEEAQNMGLTDEVEARHRAYLEDSARAQLRMSL